MKIMIAYDGSRNAKLALAQTVTMFRCNAPTLILAGVAWAGIVAPSAGESSASGQALPAFELPLLAGGEIERGALDGQVTVINFWASWCPPCRSEAPVLRTVAEDTEGQGVRFLGVLHDDSPGPATEFVERFGLGFPTAIDDGSLARALGVRGIPTTFIVDPNGKITTRHFGPISETRLRVLIEDARSAAPPPGEGE